MASLRTFQLLHRRRCSSLVCWLATLHVAVLPSTAFSIYPNCSKGHHRRTSAYFLRQTELGDPTRQPSGPLTLFSRLHSSTMLSATTKKRGSPSAERNKEPIWHVFLSKVMPQSHDLVRMLEIAGGAGVHMHHFTLELMQRGSTAVSYHYQPTDPEFSSLESQQAYLDALPTNRHPNVVVASPLQLTLDERGIQEEGAIAELSKRQPWDIIVNINMIHISPWAATLGLMKTAGTYLRPGGILYLYGPYRVNGVCVESNLKFEEWLHSLDPGFGLRDLEKVVEAAEAHGLELLETVEMPANNLSVILRKTS